MKNGEWRGHPPAAKARSTDSPHLRAPAFFCILDTAHACLAVRPAPGGKDTLVTWGAAQIPTFVPLSSSHPGGSSLSASAKPSGPCASRTAGTSSSSAGLWSRPRCQLHRTRQDDTEPKTRYASRTTANSDVPLSSHCALYPAAGQPAAPQQPEAQRRLIVSTALRTAQRPWGSYRLGRTSCSSVEGVSCPSTSASDAHELDRMHM